MENLADYSAGTGYLDRKGATTAPDGSVRLVVAATDPGTSNWVDSGSRDHGVMGLRFIRPTTRPEITCSVVPVAGLA
jgi:hypothetical protein